MINVFDTGFLYHLFDDRANKAKVQRDRHGKPLVDRVQDRIDHLVQTISQKKGKILIAAPTLAEFLLLAEEKYMDYLTIIRRKAVFEIVGFDDPEAVELAKHWKKHGDSKTLKPHSLESWAKLKFDRQIIAIGKTRRAECIYSIDQDLHDFAEQAGIKSIGLAELPLPPPRQLRLVEQTPKFEEATRAESPEPARAAEAPST